MPRKKRQSKSRTRKLLREQLAAEIARAQGAGESGRETCGLLIDNGYLIELLPMKNRSKRLASFQLRWKSIKRAGRAARRIGHRVVGTYHSHPASPATPGESDIEGAEKGSLMLILACVEGDAKLWRIRRRLAVKVRFGLIG